MGTKHKGRYAVARKGKWYSLMVCPTKRAAEEYIKGKEAYLEIRKVYE